MTGRPAWELLTDSAASDPWSMLMRTRSLAVIAALLAFAALCTTPAAASTAAQPALGSSDRVVTLPTGQQVALYGPPGAATSFGPPPAVTWPAADPIAGPTMHGHQSATPASPLPTPAGNLQSYALTRLAGGPAAPAAPAANVTATTSTSSGGSGSHNFWTLTINPVPAPGAI